jgi:hypothetical protein
MGADRNDRNDVTNGELYRILEEHGKTLFEIREDVKRQNGRVGLLETSVEVIKSSERIRSEYSRDNTARWGAFAALLASVPWSKLASFLFGKP